MAKNQGGEVIGVEIYRLLRERFGSLARFGGPLFAGVHTNRGISGGLYLDQQKQWLWLPETGDHLRPEDALLSDEAVARCGELSTVVKNLIKNTRSVFDLYLEHLQRINGKSTFPADLGVYLTDDVA